MTDQPTWRKECANQECNGINAGIDECIQPLIDALNNAGIETVASCCGHRNRPGSVILKDGRELIIAPDLETARAIDKAFPDIHGRPLQKPTRIENWCLVSGTDDPYIAPESRPPCVVGEVYDHPEFEDGETIKTSQIVEFENGMARSLNTDYTLGQIDPEYLKFYPKAADLCSETPPTERN